VRCNMELDDINPESWRKLLAACRWGGAGWGGGEAEARGPSHPLVAQLDMASAPPSCPSRPSLNTTTTTTLRALPCRDYCEQPPVAAAFDELAGLLTGADPAASRAAGGEVAGGSRVAPPVPGPPAHAAAGAQPPSDPHAPRCGPRAALPGSGERAAALGLTSRQAALNDSSPPLNLP